MKTYTIYMALIVGLFSAALAWIVTSRQDDYRAYHTAIAQESTASAANAIAGFVAEKTRLVRLFSDEHLDLVRALAAQPDSETLHQRLEQRIALYFPGYFSFTVSGLDGQPHIEDFDGLIGDLCRTDLRTFADTGSQQPRIHPHSEAYHFDVLAPFGAGQNAGILFISFHADILGEVLKSAQTSGHQLIVTDPEASDLIEVTADGARINWDREDYRLSTAEKNRILFRSEVPGTAWTIVDLSTPGLFENYSAQLIKHSVLIFLLLITITLVMLVLLRREEGLRRAAERHKDDFLSIVSHELRTPLTSIRGSLGLIAGGVTGDITDKTRSLVDAALANSERLVLLINDLLDLQKIEADQMAIDRKPVELEPFMHNCIEWNAGYAEKFGARFVLTENTPGIVVDIDEHRIAQVISNLLSNAVKYGAEQDTIEIACSQVDGYARIAITDHGPGIPESFHKRIFEKFAQLDASDNRKVNGTGLGLSIVKFITEKHGGKAGFETRVGSGSTFYIDLPVAASAA